MSTSTEACATCYGEGEVNTDMGPHLCPDCIGNGRIIFGSEQIEERIRQIELEQERDPIEARADVKWLLFELRRTRKLLWQIRSCCDDAETPEERAMVEPIRKLANAAVAPRNPALPRELLPDDAE